MKTSSYIASMERVDTTHRAHVAPVNEFGPYVNRPDARGGYFVVGEWEFHWFEGAAVRGERPEWLKTRDEAMRAAVAASRAMHAGALSC